MRRITPTQKLAWFGAPMPIDASHALCRMAHVAAPSSRALRRARRHVLLPKDYCVLQLTGEVAADPISAVGLVDRDSAMWTICSASCPARGEKLPPLRDITHCVGRVRDGLPCAGAPVVVGAMDAWAGMFGVGVVRDGDAMYQSGTSEMLGIISPRHLPTPGVIVFPPYEGIVLHAAPTQAGGASLAWLAALLGQDAGALSTLVAATPPSASVPLFLPHLQGERAPLWDLEIARCFCPHG